MWIWEPNFKHTSLTRLAEGPRKDLKISCAASAPHESSHQTAEPPPGTREAGPAQELPCLLCPHHLQAGHSQAVIERCYPSDASSRPEQVHGLKRVSSACLRRHAPAATSGGSFYIAKMPLLCLGRFEIKLAETWLLQIPTLVHL